MTTTTASSSSSPLAAVVAANVYITAGGDPSRHRPILSALVKQAQEMIRAVSLNQSAAAADDSSTGTLISKNEPTSTSCGILVHAYTDLVYNRSSWHLAGSPHVIATVVPALVTSAIQQLLLVAVHDNEATSTQNDALLSNNGITPHPTVGLVDHVAIMPLVPDYTDDTNAQLVESQRAASSVAHRIRSTLEQTGPCHDVPRGEPVSFQALPYGIVHPTDHGNDEEYIALAEVRRTRTRFFQTIAKPQPSAASASLTNRDSTDNHQHVILVGAPRYFVENYNVRLTAQSHRTDAQRLCRLLRQSSGCGLPYVEALVLPYGPFCTEVACNLLRPTVTSSADIDAVVAAAAAAHVHHPEMVVERAYRVGTTARQCLDALHKVSSSSPHTARTEYDQQVLQEWSDCWSSQGSTLVANNRT
jgi:hypothetical protein